jgi:hypothetical protein
VPQDAFRIVFEGSSFEAAVVRGKLESEGLHPQLWDDNISNLLPMTTVSPGHFGVVKVVVPMDE